MGEFITLSVDDNMTDSELALLNGGWNKRRLVDDLDISELGKRDVKVFKATVPEFGTYRVEFAIRAGQKDIENMTLFAGRRNMVAKSVYVRKGELFYKLFYQAVFPYIPALSSKRRNDMSVYISISGLTPDFDENNIEINIYREDVSVIWVAGDSTLTDQNAGVPYYPYGSCTGWAQTLQRYVDRAAVCNLSHSGLTTNCFRDDGHYDIFRNFVRRGDYFIMQFGHNDQKRRNLSAFGGYKDNLKKYVDEARTYGATPIICSPMSRIPLALSETEAKELSMSRRYSLLYEYACACKEVCTEHDVCFIDLHKKTLRKWVELGDKAKDYFMPADITHTNEYGALLTANFFMCELRKKGSFEFDNGAELTCFSPDMDTKILPAEKAAPDIFSIEPPYVDIKDISMTEREGIRKAFRYGLLDPCVMYLHPYDVMPRGQLLMVMFNAFRMAGVRPYKKKYSDIKVDEWISGYVQALINEGLLSDETSDENSDQNGNGTDPGHADLFRPDDPLTYVEFADFLISKIRKDGKLSALENAKETKKSEEFDVNDDSKDNSLTSGSNVETSIRLGLFKSDIPDSSVPINRAEVYTALANYMDIVNNANQSLPTDVEVHPVH